MPTPDQIRANRVLLIETLERDDMQDKQGKDQLECDGKFCCLGIAASLICPETRTVLDGDAHYGAVPISSVAPREVVDGLGLLGTWGEFDRPNGTTYSLAEMNDDEGASFREIAALLRTGVAFAPLDDEPAA